MIIGRLMILPARCSMRPSLLAILRLVLVNILSALLKGSCQFVWIALFERLNYII